MKTKVILIVSAVIALCLGLVLTAVNPAMGFVSTVFELGIGGYLGYLWGKDKFEGVVKCTEALYKDLMDKNMELEAKMAKPVKEKKAAKKTTVKE